MEGGGEGVLRVRDSGLELRLRGRKEKGEGDERAREKYIQ